MPHYYWSDEENELLTFLVERELPEPLNWSRLFRRLAEQHPNSSLCRRGRGAIRAHWDWLQKRNKKNKTPTATKLEQLAARLEPEPKPVHLGAPPPSESRASSPSPIRHERPRRASQRYRVAAKVAGPSPTAPAPWAPSTTPKGSSSSSEECKAEQEPILFPIFPDSAALLRPRNRIDELEESRCGEEYGPGFRLVRGGSDWSYFPIEFSICWCDRVNGILPVPTLPRQRVDE